MTEVAADDVVERAFRAEAGRALATIAALTGDLDLAEDAVQEAFVAAMRTWPRRGIPERPGAWITTAARNHARDVLRRERRRGPKETAAARDALERSAPVLHPAGVDQLQLMFTCCHPSLAPEARVALTLRLVSGLRVAEIARALLQGEEAVAKRIQRAKGKIRDAGIPLRAPPPDVLPERVPAVLECIYLTYAEGYAATAGEVLIRHELCDESLRLARLLADLVPGDPGIEALLALLLLQDSRRPSRLGADGTVVLLADQDRRRWDHDRIDEGFTWLQRACAHDRVSAGSASYLLQAAVAAEHARADHWETTDWSRIVTHYDRLLELTGSPAVAVNRAVALSFADGPAVAVPVLDALLEDPRVSRSHRLHAASADVRRRAGRPAEARAAYRRAIELAGNEPERDHLERQLATLATDESGCEDGRTGPAADG